MQHRARPLALRWLSIGVGLLASGCFGTPTPLAPGRSGSVGLPHHGVQTGAVELPESGPGFVRFRKHGEYHWGQPHLVRAVQAAALQVHEAMPHGAPLLVGDLSARHGGKIPRHASHRSGRDVDLLWYVTTEAGAPIENPGFVLMGPDGLARVEGANEYVSIDVPRQWLLIKALLMSPDVDVQWMFVSTDIEAILVNYALARGDDPEVIWRAQNVMVQPRGSLPHDDHLHLRVACSPEATLEGCEGGGPRWSWLPETPTLPSMPESALSVLVGDDPPTDLLSLAEAEPE